MEQSITNYTNTITPSFAYLVGPLNSESYTHLGPSRTFVHLPDYPPIPSLMPTLPETNPRFMRKSYMLNAPQRMARYRYHRLPKHSLKWEDKDQTSSSQSSDVYSSLGFADASPSSNSVSSVSLQDTKTKGMKRVANQKDLSSFQPSLNPDRVVANSQWALSSTTMSILVPVVCSAKHKYSKRQFTQHRLSSLCPPLHTNLPSIPLHRLHTSSRNSDFPLPHHCALRLVHRPINNIGCPWSTITVVSFT